MRSLIKKMVRFFAIMLLVLVGLEFAFRFQIVPLYDAELMFFNDQESLTRAEGEAGILILGDSFTAGFHTFASSLSKQDSLPVINSAMGGTGVVEAEIIAKARFDRFNPKHLVYQIYVGNDLLNLQRPVNWQRQSPMRNVYSLLSRYFRVMPFLNYRLGQAMAEKVDPATAVSPLETAEFDPRTYSSVERLYVQSYPENISDQILLRGSISSSFSEYEYRLSKLLDQCRPPACTTHVLLVPHKAQVNIVYQSQLEEIGALLPEAESLLEHDYPFLQAVQAMLEVKFDSVQLINPLPAFQQSEMEGRAVFAANDLHLNSEGQEILARLISESIFPDDSELIHFDQDLTP